MTARARWRGEQFRFRRCGVRSESGDRLPDSEQDADRGTAPAPPPREFRRYDSFHVRLWHRPGTAPLLRIEIKHLQTDLVESATAVPVTWLCETILALLATDAAPDERT
jgi:hypothetical protein